MRKWDGFQGKGRTGKIKERKRSCPPRPSLTKTSVFDLMEGKSKRSRRLTDRVRQGKRQMVREREKESRGENYRQEENRKMRKAKNIYIYIRTHIEKILCHTHTQLLKDARQIQEVLLFQFMHKQGICFNSNPCCGMLISCKTKHYHSMCVFALQHILRLTEIPRTPFRSNLESLSTCLLMSPSPSFFPYREEALVIHSLICEWVVRFMAALHFTWIFSLPL